MTEWIHPIDGGYGTFNNKLVTFAMRHWEYVDYEYDELNSPSVQESGRIKTVNHKIVPETELEFIENFALAVQRKFPWPVNELRLSVVDLTGLIRKQADEEADCG